MYYIILIYCELIFQRNNIRLYLISVRYPNKAITFIVRQQIIQQVKREVHDLSKCNNLRN